MEIMDQHKSDFGIDFTDNKKALDKVSIIRSKGLKNEIAGFITKYIKHEIREQKEKEEREKQFDQQMSENQTEVSETIDTSGSVAEDASVIEESTPESTETTSNESQESAS